MRRMSPRMTTILTGMLSLIRKTFLLSSLFLPRLTKPGASPLSWLLAELSGTYLVGGWAGLTGLVDFDMFEAEIRSGISLFQTAILSAL